MSATLLALTPVLLAGGGLAAEALLARRDRRRFPPPGRMVDVGGHRLHARVLGSGDPVVVLEAGAGEWSSHWERLPDRLSELTTVLAYDRAGLGWSDPGPEPRTAETQARELRQLLRELFPNRPVVLVGHSVGAHVLRAFAHRYPFELAGLVFVDGYHEALEQELAREGVPSPGVPLFMLRLYSWAARLGLLRLLRHSSLGPAARSLELPATHLRAIDVLGRSSSVMAGVLAEQRALPTSDREVATYGDHLDVPLHVLTAGESLPALGTPASYPRETFNRVWRRVNARLAELSEDGRVQVVEGADHLLPLRSPHLVLEAVRSVVEAARGAAVRS